MMATLSSNSRRSSPIPDDVVFDILARLPVKSLMRFKSVCKTWSDIITNPHFISVHLTNSRSGKRTRSRRCGGVSVSSRVCLAYEQGLPEFVYDFLKIHVGDLPPSNMMDTFQYKAPYDAVAETLQTEPFSVAGYRDGIFCLSWRHFARDTLQGYGVRGSRHTTIALCNPAIRELRILPMSDSDFPPYLREYAVDIGFGYDPKTDDYKVVKVVTMLGSEGLDILEVYSMRTNSWEKQIIIRGNEKYTAVQKIMALAHSTGSYTTENWGVLHWTMWTLMEGDKEFVIVSFFMNDNSLRVTRLPSEHYWFGIPKTSLLNQKLAVVGSTDDASTIEVLVMKDYGLDDESCWSPVSTLKGPLYGCCSPLGFWKDNVLLMFNEPRHKPLLLHIATEQSMNLEELTNEMDFYYTETLLSVKQTLVLFDLRHV